MRAIFGAGILLLALISCGGEQAPTSVPAERAVPKLIVAKKEALSPAKPPPEVKRKAFAGKATFEELTNSQLLGIRIIPESGRELIVPKNQHYDQVDGLWVMGAKPNQWFKIPDHSEVWVGAQPPKFDGTAHLGSLKIYYRSSPVLRFVGAIKNGVKHPAWVPDSGDTRSPVPSPWERKN